MTDTDQADQPENSPAEDSAATGIDPTAPAKDEAGAEPTEAAESAPPAARVEAAEAAETAVTAAPVAAAESAEPAEESAEPTEESAAPAEPVQEAAEATEPGEPEEADPAFGQFALDARLLKAVADLGFTAPTPIQTAAIGPMLEGSDIVASARTGSGKTAAFGLPLLHALSEGPNTVRGIVLAPTRELCGQVGDALRSYAKHVHGLTIATIYGGAPYQPQIRAIRNGARIVVGTPGRVIDHIERGNLMLDDVEVFVLDEADEMLQMGFIDEVGKIMAATPDGRQIALFSATMPAPIRAIADRYLTDPVRVRPDAPRTSVNHVEQHVVVVPAHQKLAALARFVRSIEHDAILVFSRTRAACAEAAEQLERRGLKVDALHGDLSQPARERVVHRMRERLIDVVIATDVAARGLDINRISHVFNLDIPMNAEVYTHRIGRTARAGRKGVAITFVTHSERSKIGHFARRLKADIEPLTVPSDASIAASQRERLVASFADAGDREDAVWDVYNAIEKNTDLSAKQIAAAALRRLAVHERVELDLNPDDSPPDWALPRRQRSRNDATDGRDMAELMILAGRKAGARPTDIVASLVRGFEVPAGLLGRITILPNRSFVQMPVEELQRILASHDTMQIRGDDYPIASGAKKPGREGGRKGGFKKGGFKKGGGFKRRDDDGGNRGGGSKKGGGYKRRDDDNGGNRGGGYKKGGYKKDGFKKDGFKKDGFKKDGFKKDGFKKDGFKKGGFNKGGFKRDGFKKDDRPRNDGATKPGYKKDAATRRRDRKQREDGGKGKGE